MARAASDSRLNIFRTTSAVAPDDGAGASQIVRDNAELVEQLKAEQAQMAQLIAKASEQKNLRPKAPAPPPLLTANPNPTRNRADASVAQPRVQPQARIQLKKQQ